MRLQIVCCVVVTRCFQIIISNNIFEWLSIHRFDRSYGFLPDVQNPLRSSTQTEILYLFALIEWMSPLSICVAFVIFLVVATDRVIWEIWALNEKQIKKYYEFIQYENLQWHKANLSKWWYGEKNFTQDTILEKYLMDVNETMKLEITSVNNAGKTLSWNRPINIQTNLSSFGPNKDQIRLDLLWNDPLLSKSPTRTIVYLNSLQTTYWRHVKIKKWVFMSFLW